MIDKEIVKEFVSESKNLIQDLLRILEDIEVDAVKSARLTEFGNLVDRIMGGAKSLGLSFPEVSAFVLIGDYAALCKAVGYKASKINDNAQLFDVCIALLLDGMETLDKLLDILLDRVELAADEIKKMIPTAFIERLYWVSERLNVEFGESGGPKQPALSQSEIDSLMKKLGM